MSVRISVSTAAPTVNLSGGTSGGSGGTSDHRALLHRDAEDQHPIGAITGLAEALEAGVPIASETVLGGIKVGVPSRNKLVYTCGEDGRRINDLPTPTTPIIN
jgi:hypothetical protein